MEEILNWHWWMYAAIILFISEVFTPGFIVACLGLGSVIASIFAYLGFDIDVQFMAFAISTLISLFLIRPLLYKKGVQEDKIKTNTDALIGRTGKVLETIENINNKGRVMIDGDQWKACSHNNEIIQANTQVEVISIDSTIITVKKI